MEWVEVLKKKYGSYVKSPRQSITFLISYLTERLDCVPQANDFMGEYFLNILNNNAYNCITNESHMFNKSDFSFKCFTIALNERSHVYYKEKEHGETIYAIFEEKTGYIESNCHLLFLELFIERGIDDIDLALENNFCKYYLTFLKEYKNIV